MKKVLLLAIAAVMSICINAQGIKTLQAPTGTLQREMAASFNGNFQDKFQKAGKLTKRNAMRKADLAANERIVGLYTTDDLAEKGLGLTSLPNTYELFTLIPSSCYNKLDGQIKAIRFGIAQSCTIKGVAAYSIDRNGNLTPISEVELDGTYPAGWNTIALPELCDFPAAGNDLMLSFTYVQTKNNYPISVISLPAQDCFLLYGNLGDGEGFYDFSSNGALSIQAIAECKNLPKQDIILEDIALSNNMVPAGEELLYGFDIYNYGTDDIESMKIEVRLDGKLIDIITEKSIEGGITHSPKFHIGKIVLPEDTQRGEHDITVELIEVNGAEPAGNTEDDKLGISFCYYTSADVVARQKHLVEEMTSHSCTYCPLGAKVLERMLEKSNKLAVACIHGNQSSKDPFNTTECQNLLSYLDCYGFPSATFNRIYFGEDGLAPSIGYNEQYQEQAADMFLESLEKYSIPSFASVKIAKELSENNSQLTITVSGKGEEYASQILKDFSITVYVLEDSLKYRQLNNGTWITNYIHNHVLRKVATAINGDDINWTSGSEYSNTFTVALNSAWKTDKLSVVAFLSRRENLTNPDPSLMYVTNANKVDVLGNDSDGDNGDGDMDDIAQKIDAGLLITAMSDKVQLMGEGISLNGKYVSGSNYATYQPAIWNTETGELTEFSDFEEGTLHTVSNNGIAVGTTGGMEGKALITTPDGKAHVLPDNAGENSQGSEAYCITEDGSMAGGFYFYFAYTNEEQTEGFYAVYPCVWKNDVCTTLPYPSHKDVGFAVDGAGIRWMSKDGKILLGYLIDDLSKWPAVIWRQNENGEYVCDPICKEYFEMGYQQGKPYMLFTPSGISPNGEWIALNVQEEYDDWDWDTMPPAVKAARYNLNTKELQVLDMEVDMNSTAITNDGTVLAYTLTDGMVGRVGYLWLAGQEKAVCLDDELNTVVNMPLMVANTPCAFAEDGLTMQGFGVDTDANIFSYVLNLANLGNIMGTGIEEVKEETTIAEGTQVYNLAGQRVVKMQKGLYIANGKKILK